MAAKAAEETGECRKGEEMSMEKICKNCIAFGTDGICRQTESRLFGKERCLYETCENWIARMSDEYDNVNHPAHYTSGGIECIDCIKAALGENFIGFLIGNVIKYSYRYRHKNGVTDLEKASVYLKWAIEEMKKNETT